MHARVATIEGTDPDRVRENAEAIRSRSSSGPPEGVPAVGFLLLHDEDEGKLLLITLYETEEDMRKGDAALNAMNPPGGESAGARRSVEMFEVLAKLGA